MTTEKFTPPTWVNWIAQDADGSWWGYSAEPHQFHQGWYENEVGERILLARDEPNSQWQDTLRATGANYRGRS